ncbi:MAG: DUF2125 domain-containing protein [Rhodobacteraceae bacterium]|nr:DUF2125 domain-containing protein [Paracoccaceae bacterium]
MLIRSLIAGAIVLIVGWSGYWLVVSRSYKNAIVELLDDANSSSWQTEHDAVSVRGFPNRLDARIDNLQLQNTDWQVRWSVPWVDILSLSYRFNHAILVLPPPHSLSVEGEEFTFETLDIRSSVEFASTSSLRLERLIVEFDSAEPPQDGQVQDSHSKTVFAVQARPEAANIYDISLKTSNPPPAQPAASGNWNVLLLGALLQQMDVSAKATLRQPLDRFSCENDSLEILELDIAKAGLPNDPSGLEVSGRLTAMENGNLEGVLRVSVQDILAFFNQTFELLPLSDNEAKLLELALRAIAKFDSDMALDVLLANSGVTIGWFTLKSTPIPAKIC